MLLRTQHDIGAIGIFIPTYLNDEVRQCGMTYRPVNFNYKCHQHATTVSAGEIKRYQC